MNHTGKILTTLIIFMFSIGLALAFPPIGHQFYGDVTFTASDISFHIDSLEFDYAISSSQYGYDPIVMLPADDPDTVDIEGGNDGDVIEIYIDNGYVGDYIYEIEGITNLNFDTPGNITGDDDDDDGSSGDDDDSGDNDDDDDGNNPSNEYFYYGSSGTGDDGCIHYWRCEDWSNCEWVNNAGEQSRTCTYAGDCEGDFPYPQLTNECEYEPTCIDNIQNQGEEGIDCGGPCTPCPTTAPTTSCFDSIKNQGEEGIDCGGPCDPCAIKKEMPQKSNIGSIILWIVILIILLGLVALAYLKRDSIAELYIETRLKYAEWRNK